LCSLHTTVLLSGGMREEAVAALVAPGCFVARFETSAGDFTIEAHRSWAPLGVDRLYSLLRASYYDDTRVYRVVKGWVAQFGYSGSPRRQRAQSIISDDRSTTAPSNLRGVLAYSASYETSMQHATNRTTELYINLADHPQLDALGFTPVANVTRGMDTAVDAFYSGYGEMLDACTLHGFLPCDGPIEERILSEGNAYLDVDFPLLTRIYSATIVHELSSSDTDMCPPPTPPPSSTTPHALHDIFAVLAGALGVVGCMLWAVCAWRRPGAMQRRCRRSCRMLPHRCPCPIVGRASGEQPGGDSRSGTRVEGVEGVTLQLASHDSAAMSAAQPSTNAAAAPGSRGA
jgi:peptidyl-prolyl cis-trans isomerase A (cyclophilin A)